MINKNWSDMDEKELMIESVKRIDRILFYVGTIFWVSVVSAVIFLLNG
jgi:hypothetical protein